MMLHRFSYYDNSPRKENKPPALIMDVLAEGILDADKVFKETTGINPAEIRHSYIGCIVTFNVKSKEEVA